MRGTAWAINQVARKCVLEQVVAGLHPHAAGLTGLIWAHLDSSGLVSHLLSREPPLPCISWRQWRRLG
jgi:hypothetical protein